VTNEGPVWGFHVDDVNLALGDLVPDVAWRRALTADAAPYTGVNGRAGPEGKVGVRRRS
jgi:hypothetical protein